MNGERRDPTVSQEPDLGLTMHGESRPPLARESSLAHSADVGIAAEWMAAGDGHRMRSVSALTTNLPIARAPEHQKSRLQNVVIMIAKLTIPMGPHVEKRRQ